MLDSGDHGNGYILINAHVVEFVPAIFGKEQNPEDQVSEKRWTREEGECRS